MKVDELTGIYLDYWLAKAEDIKIIRGEQFIIDENLSLEWAELNGFNLNQYYTKIKWSKCEYVNGAWAFYAEKLMIDWNFVGKIIERDRLIIEDETLSHHSNNYIIIRNGVNKYFSYGKTKLEAIKKCIVKCKFGGTVNEKNN